MKSTLLTIAVLIACTASSQSLVLDDVYPEEIAGDAFTLSSASAVSIKGSGAVFYEDWKAIVYYGWIIDSETREVVWHLFDEMKDQDFRDSDDRIDYNVKVDLPKGAYEAYFAAARSNGNDWNDWGNTWAVQDFDDVVKKIFSSRERRSYRSSYSDEFYMEVSSNNLRKTDLNDLVEKKVNSAVLSFNRVGDKESLKKGFSLNKKTDLRIYAVGEGSRDESYDYFWIFDAKTRDVVVEMDYHNTDFAGGAEKNIKFDKVVTLDAGDYIMSYATDGSHSYDEWNALPPDDPQFWGVTVWLANAGDRNNVVPYREPKTATPIVDITRMDDDEFESKGITLKKDMDVRILCLGEEGNDGMADYGWIVDANTRERVWEMKRYKTDHAGGANKNRKISEVVSLEAGDYVVYYTTDGSHSYGDWNSTRPHEEEMWGITLWATDESDMKSIASFDPDDFRYKNSLVEILRVRDDEYIRERFTLDQDTDVRILGLGEGTSGDMHDYGYIKDEDGRTIWEMEYYDSDHAGGARKNREFNDKIRLKKGTYRVTYRTDGSHSFGDWNASPPSDEEMWGILILKEN